MTIFTIYSKGELEKQLSDKVKLKSLFSVKNNNVKKIAWIHNDISQVFGRGLKSKIKKRIDRKIYSKYKTLVFVSRDNLKKFNQIYKDIRNQYLEPIKKEVIYNYIDKEVVKKKAK